MAQPPAILFSPDGRETPASLGAWLAARGAPVVAVRSADDLLARALRGRPLVVVFDARGLPEVTIAACRRLKSDSYTGIVPAAVYCADQDGAFAAAFEAGADEVLRDGGSESELRLRLDALLRRSERDTLVHPTTRLPGTVAIEAEITQRLASGAPFAVCYADLDHFKEFNDRYSYYDGDRVIRMLANILHDVVKGVCGETGFVGHIGGDDFIAVLPLTAVAEVCDEVISVFDTLIPYHYSEQDRRSGCFFGKDRRGQLHRVPLMSVSIGVVTNERRTFSHAAQVSELATEMKSYAKSLPGSVWAVDRRHDAGLESPAAAVRPNPLGAVHDR